MTLSCSNPVSRISSVTDKNCSGPMCIRRIQEIAGGMWVFDLTFRFNSGILRTVGWKYSPKRNTIYAPFLRGESLHPAIVLTPKALMQLRKLLTTVLASKGVTVPELRRKNGNKT